MKLRLNMLLKDTDKGWTAILSGAAKIARKSGPVVDIGISDGMGEKVLRYAFVHEFGSTDGRIKERSYVRSTIDRNATKYKALVKGVALAAQAAMVAAAQSNPAAAWQKVAEQGLDKIGRLVVADIRALIMSGALPKIQDSTIARKQAQGMPHPEIPLVGWGVLVKSVAHRVRSNKKAGA